MDENLVEKELKSEIKSEKKDLVQEQNKETELNKKLDKHLEEKIEAGQQNKEKTGDGGAAGTDVNVNLLNEVIDKVKHAMPEEIAPNVQVLKNSIETAEEKENKTKGTLDLTKLKSIELTKNMIKVPEGTAKAQLSEFSKAYNERLSEKERAAKIKNKRSRLYRKNKNKLALLNAGNKAAEKFGEDVSDADFIALAEDFLKTDTSNIDLSSDDAVVAASGRMEELTAKCNRMRELMGRNQRRTDDLEREVRSKILDKMKTLMQITGFYRVCRMIITDEYYSTHYNDEIGRFGAMDDDYAKQRLTSLILLRTSMQAEMTRILPRELRETKRADKLLVPATEKEQEELHNLVDVNGFYSAEFGKLAFDAYSTEYSVHNDKINSIKNDDFLLHDKHELDGFVTSESIFRTKGQLINLRSMQGLSMPEEKIDALFRDLNAKEGDGLTKEQAREIKINALKTVRDMMIEQVSYVRKKYGSSVFYLNPKTAEKHRDEIVRDLQCMTNVGEFLSFVKKVPALFEDKWDEINELGKYTSALMSFNIEYARGGKADLNIKELEYNDKGVYFGFGQFRLGMINIIGDSLMGLNSLEQIDAYDAQLSFFEKYTEQKYVDWEGSPERMELDKAKELAPLATLAEKLVTGKDAELSAMLKDKKLPDGEAGVDYLRSYGMLIKHPGYVKIALRRYELNDKALEPGVTTKLLEELSGEDDLTPDETEALELYKTLVSKYYKLTGKNDADFKAEEEKAEKVTEAAEEKTEEATEAGDEKAEEITEEKTETAEETIKQEEVTYNNRIYGVSDKDYEAWDKAWKARNKRTWRDPGYIGFDAKFTRVRKDDSVRMEKVRSKLADALEEIEKEKRGEKNNVIHRLTMLKCACDQYFDQRKRRYFRNFGLLRPFYTVKYATRSHEVSALRKRVEAELKKRTSDQAIKLVQYKNIDFDLEEKRMLGGAECYGGAADFGVSVLAVGRKLIENPIRYVLRGLITPFWAVNELVRKIVQWGGNKPQRHLHFPRIYSMNEYYEMTTRALRGFSQRPEHYEHWYDRFFERYKSDQETKDIQRRADLDMDTIRNDYEEDDYHDEWKEFEAYSKPETEKEKKRTDKYLNMGKGNVNIGISFPSPETIEIVEGVNKAEEEKKKAEEQKAEEEKKAAEQKAEEEKKTAEKKSDLKIVQNAPEQKKSEEKENKAVDSAQLNADINKLLEKFKNDSINTIKKAEQTAEKQVQKQVQLQKAAIKQADKAIPMKDYHIRLPQTDWVIQNSVRQGKNNCYACSGSLAFNTFLYNKGELNKDTMTDQDDIRSHKPVFKAYKDFKAEAQNAMGGIALDENTARKLYDDYKNSVVYFCGAGKETVGNYFEIADYFFQKKKDVAINHMIISLPGDKYKNVMRDHEGNLKYTSYKPGEKERFDLTYNKMRNAFLDKVYEVLQTGNPVSLLRTLSSGASHYITICGIDGNELIYADSIFPRQEMRGTVDSVINRSGAYGGGQSIQLTWFSDVGDIKELQKKYPSLHHDKKKGFSKNGENMNELLHLSHLEGITVSMDRDLGKNEIVTEYTYLPKKYGVEK